MSQRKSDHNPDNPDGSIADCLSEFVDLVADAVDDHADDVRDQGERLVDRVQDLEESVEDLDEKIESTKDQAIGNAAGAHERVNDLCDRVDELEQATLDQPAQPTQPDAPTEFETPLETVVAWPDYVAEDKLSANKQRARTIAKDFDDYSTEVGTADHRKFAVTSRDIRQLVKAKEDRADLPRRETANRIIDFLERLGKEKVEVTTTTSGMKQVVIGQDDLPDLVQAANCRCQPDQNVISCVTG